MNTSTIERTVRHIFLAAVVTTGVSLPVQAATTTYYQVKNFELDGLPSGEAGGVEITDTPQLAFPNVTLENIKHCTFLTKLYGDEIDDDYATAWGTYPQSCDLDGDGLIDKLAFQFAVYDGGNTKVVVIALTNGEGGVYAQWARRSWRTNANGLPDKQYYNMSADGTINSQNATGTGTECNGKYRASGIRLHGTRLDLDSTARLAFPGTTLEQLKGSSFMAGYRQGLWFSHVATNNAATCVTDWTDSSGAVKKIIMQFSHPTDGKKTAVVALTNGVDGVYASQVLSVSGLDNADTQAYSVDASGNITVANGSYQNTGDSLVYPVHEFYVQYPQCVKRSPTQIKVFSDKSKTLTLDDIVDGDFTARLGGVSGQAQGTLDIPNSAIGCNKKLRYDDSDNLTNVVVEFQTQCGTSVRCVIVSFENGADGVYATGLGARYATGTVGGYEFYKDDGSFAGNIIALAETPTGNYYGALDLRVVVSTTRIVHDWTLDANKNWSDFPDHATLGPDDVVRIKVEDATAVLTIDANVALAQVEFVDGLCAQMIVNIGKTMTVQSISGVNDILNNGTIVKTGDGTIAVPFNNVSRGVYQVNSGMLMASKVITDGSTPGFITDDTPSENQLVDVKAFATFDLNRVNGITAAVRLEEGAHFANSGDWLANNQNQPVQLILAGNAEANGTGNFGIVRADGGQTRIDLGTNTLTIANGANNTTFFLGNTTITGTGTIAVNKGTLVIKDANATGTDCTIVIGANGRFQLNTGFCLSVKNFINNGVDNSSNDKGGTVVVNGTITPGNAIKRLTLTDGATVKMIGRNSLQTVTKAFSCFGTVTIDASVISANDLLSAEKERIAILTVPGEPGDLNSSATWTVTSGPFNNCRARWIADGGGNTSTLYLYHCAFTIFVR